MYLLYIERLLWKTREITYLKREGKEGEKRGSCLDKENSDQDAQQPASQDIDQVMNA
jgi:hypothetical protein